jgi:hypothetical protein
VLLAEELKFDSRDRCSLQAPNKRNFFRTERQFAVFCDRHISAAEKPYLAAREIALTACLQFAARLVGGVNVRVLRESQTEIKYLTRRWISRRITRRLVHAPPLECLQAIESAFEFHGDTRNSSRHAA